MDVSSFEDSIEIATLRTMHNSSPIPQRRYAAVQVDRAILPLQRAWGSFRLSMLGEDCPAFAPRHALNNLSC